jgi:hypothetical protein
MRRERRGVDMPPRRRAALRLAGTVRVHALLFQAKAFPYSASKRVHAFSALGSL